MAIIPPEPARHPSLVGASKDERGSIVMSRRPQISLSRYHHGNTPPQNPSVKYMTTIVTPGNVIGAVDKNEAGDGVMQQNDDLIALVTGTLVDTDGKLSIETYTDFLEIEVGDYVIGEVVKLYEKSGEIKVLSVEGKANRSIEASKLFAQLHVTKITDRFLHNSADALRRRDIVRAKVIDAGNVLRVDMREEEKCGVLWALCPPCGDLFIADQDGDWNVNCPTCDNRSFRALADDFGGESGNAALNGTGKRWGGAAEALFAKGSAGRATFIAEDIREDGREREYFQFEGEGGRGGGGGRERRQKAAPGCRLFIGGISRDLEDDELKAKFNDHGKITDFALMKDENGNSRGFGFITFAKKEMADAAVAALDGQRIKGRRLGVRDADAPKEESPRQKRPDGARIYVGNLPFKASEDELAALFRDDCESVHAQWATDRQGRKKAFAFVTVKPESAAKAVAEKLNGYEMMGRTLKVEVSKPRDRDQNQRDRKPEQKSEKSSREIRALAEEEADAKKKPRSHKKN